MTTIDAKLFVPPEVSWGSVTTAPQSTSATNKLPDFAEALNALKVAKEPQKMTIIVHPETKPKVIEPVSITENKKNDTLFTTVKWNDGTYTTVKVCQEDMAVSSPYMAFCAALAKKMYGTNSKVHRMVDRHMSDYLKAQAKKEADEKRRKQKAEEHRIHHRKVLAAAKRMRIKEEAKKYNKTHEFECCCEND